MLEDNRYGKFFTNFLPAMAEKAKKAIRKEIRSWRLQLKLDKSLTDIANMFEGIANAGVYVTSLIKDGK